MNSTDLAIDARGLGKAFAVKGLQVDVFSDIDLQVRHGEFLSILGSSGCGKTTLLRVLARLEEHTSGEIVIRQRAADRGKPVSATVFQEPSVFPWMTVARNVEYGMRALGVDRKAARREVGRLLEIVGLSAAAARYPHELSGGMKQRVAVARALAVDSEILFMDEPFGLLDEPTRFALQQDLLTIWEQTGKTIVFVTHSIQESVVLSDRVIVLGSRPGRVVLEKEISLARPRSVMDVTLHPDYPQISEELHGALTGVPAGGAQ